MARREISRVGGFVHDVNTVASLSDEPNNIRLLSDRSLYILQNLSLEDVTFLSRYGEILIGGFYLPVTAGSPEESDVVDAVNIIRRDLNSMAVEALLECICAATNALVELGVLGGQDIENAPSDGEVPVGPDEQFPDQESYLVAKCNAANAIYDTVLATVRWLETNNIDLLGGLLGGMTTALAMGLLISGPVGWAVTLAAVTITGITTYLISKVINFSDLEDALVDVHDESVLALFNSSNTIVAENNFIAAIAASTEPTTAVERDLVGLMLSSDLLNLLFSPRQDVGVYQSPSPVDCDSGLLQVWSFIASGEGWTFRDDSDGTYSASGVWLSGGEEAWEITLVGIGGPNPTKAVGVIYINSLSIAAEVGGSVQMDFGALSSGKASSKHIKVIYSDLSEFEVGVSGTSAGTLILTLTDPGTIETIEVWVQRSWPSTAFTMTMEVQEVRVMGV